MSAIVDTSPDLERLVIKHPRQRRRDRRNAQPHHIVPRHRAQLARGTQQPRTPPARTQTQSPCESPAPTRRRFPSSPTLAITDVDAGEHHRQAGAYAIHFSIDEFARRSLSCVRRRLAPTFTNAHRNSTAHNRSTTPNARMVRASRPCSKQARSPPARRTPSPACRGSSSADIAPDRAR